MLVALLLLFSIISWHGAISRGTILLLITSKVAKIIVLRKLLILHFGFVAFNTIIEIVNCPNCLILLLLTICFLAAAWEGDASATEGKGEWLSS